MIYSRSTEYAIRALIPLSKAPEGKYTMVKAIAEQEKIPTHFLAKILQQLARKGLLRSSKGPMGGFSLRVPAEEIRLLDLVEALDGVRTPHLCIGGFGSCTQDQQCSMHEGWVAVAREHPGLPEGADHRQPREGARAEEEGAGEEEGEKSGGGRAEELKREWAG